MLPTQQVVFKLPVKADNTVPNLPASASKSLLAACIPIWIGDAVSRSVSPHLGISTGVVTDVWGPKWKSAKKEEESSRN